MGRHSLLSPVDGQSVITEAERALHSGEALAAKQERKSRLVEDFHPDMEQVRIPVPVDDVDRESHLAQAVGLAAATELVVLVGLTVLEAGLNHCGVLLLDLSEVLNTDNRARRPAVHQHGELVFVLTSLLGLLPLLGYIFPEVNHLAVDIYAWVCVDLQSLKELVERLELGLYLPDFGGDECQNLVLRLLLCDLICEPLGEGQKASLCCCLLWKVLAVFGIPVLILLSFPLLVSLSLGRVWVGAVLPPVVDTVTATVFPSRVTADTEITLPDPLVLA